MSCSSSFCSTSRLLSSAECDIFPWHLIHRTLLLILCTEFSCCVIWGQRLLQQPARQSAHPSTLLLLQRKGGWDKEMIQTRNRLPNLSKMFSQFLALRFTRDLSPAHPVQFVRRCIQWICQQLQILSQPKSHTFPFFSPILDSVWLL